MILCDLPPELLLIIVAHVPTESLRILCLTHSSFNNLLYKDTIWRDAILRDLGHRSAFNTANVPNPVTNGQERVSLIDASITPLTQSPAPYKSYHELYTRLLRKYGWMLGTFAGNAEWIGSLIEIFYNHITGRIECRPLQMKGLVGLPIDFSRDPSVEWRDFDPVVYTRPEPLFVLDGSTADSQLLARMQRFVGITDTATIEGLAAGQIWPSTNIPVKERTILDRQDALSRIGNGFDHFSDDLLSFTRLNFIQMPSQPEPRSMPEHKELYFRIPKPSLIPHGFEEHAGLFVGDYMTHGLELIYLYYPTVNSLRAVKITGDPNVPRGELTWRVNDLQHTLRDCTEVEWPGARAYAAEGQVSVHGFWEPAWLEAEVILYHARSDQFPHTLQSMFSPEALNAVLARQAQSASPQARQFNTINKPSVALWWKDMQHMSIYHKVTDISDEGMVAFTNAVSHFPVPVRYTASLGRL